MHLSIALVMGLPLFSAAMMIGDAVFLSDALYLWAAGTSCGSCWRTGPQQAAGNPRRGWTGSSPGARWRYRSPAATSAAARTTRGPACPTSNAAKATTPTLASSPGTSRTGAARPCAPAVTRPRWSRRRPRPRRAAAGSPGRRPRARSRCRDPTRVRPRGTGSRRARRRPPRGRRSPRRPSGAPWPPGPPPAASGPARRPPAAAVGLGSPGAGRPPHPHAPVGPTTHEAVRLQRRDQPVGRGPRRPDPHRDLGDGQPPGSLGEDSRTRSPRSSVWEVSGTAAFMDGDLRRFGWMRRRGGGVWRCFLSDLALAANALRGADATESQNPPPDSETEPTDSAHRAWKTPPRPLPQPGAVPGPPFQSEAPSGGAAGGPALHGWS